MKTTTQQYAIFLFILSLFFVVPRYAQAQWNSAQGPFGGNISSIVQFEEDLYVSGMLGGIYRSSDEGQNWSLVSTDIVEGNQLAANDEYLFAASSNKICRFDGSQWEIFPTGMDTDVMYIASFTTIDSTLLLEFYSTSTSAYSLYASLYNGDSLSLVNSLLPGHGIKAIGTSLYSYGNYGGIYRSTDKGTSWPEYLINGLPPSSASDITAVGNDLYVGIANTQQTGEGVYRSTDNGANWNPVNQGFPSNTHISALEPMVTDLYAATNSGVYRLAGAMDVWVSANSGLPYTGVQYPVHILTDIGTHLFAGTNDGVYRTLDNGSNWEPRNSGLTSPLPSNLVFMGPNLYVGTFLGIYRHIGGTSWETVSPVVQQSAPFISSIGSKDGVLFAGSIAFGVEVMRSLDQGATWEAANVGFPIGGWWVASSFLSVGPYLFASGGDVYRTSDLGVNWEPAVGGSSFVASSLATNGTEIYALSGEGLYSSSSQDIYWVPAMNIGWPDSISAGKLIANGSDLYATTRNAINHAFEYAYYSSDSGNTWTSINNGALEELKILSLDAYGPYLFAGTDGQGVFWSTDHGLTWDTMNWGMPGGARVISLVANSTELYAGIYGKGVWKTNLTNVGIDKITGDQQKFSLSPNPTTGLVTLDLNGMRDAQLVSVLDATGRVLLWKPVKGSELTLDMRSEENGMYFVEVLSTDGGRQLQKLIKQ